MKNTLFMIGLALLAACGNYKTPALDNPARMSADTLCYRAAYAKSSQALKDEVAARNLDCAAILESQAMLEDSRY